MVSGSDFFFFFSWIKYSAGLRRRKPEGNKVWGFSLIPSYEPSEPPQPHLYLRPLVPCLGTNAMTDPKWAHRGLVPETYTRSLGTPTASQMKPKHGISLPRRLPRRTGDPGVLISVHWWELGGRKTPTGKFFLQALWWIFPRSTFSVHPLWRGLIWLWSSVSVWEPTV